MSGSLKFMVYDSDDGKKYRVKIDESNGEAFGFGDMTTSRTDALEGLPRGYEMRYIVVRSLSGDFSRRVYCGHALEPEFVLGGNAVVDVLSGGALQSVPCAVSYAVGEKRPFYNAGTAPSELTSSDTGLNDGDAT